MRPSASAPATATAVAEATQMDGTIEEQWKRTIHAVNGRKRMLGAFLEESRLLGVTSDALLLGMDDLHRAVVDASEHRTIVREELTRVFGRVIDVRCTPLVAGDTPRRPSVDDVKPMIDRAIEFFDGEILDRSGRGDRTS